LLTRLAGLNISDTQLFTYVPYLALNVDAAALEVLAADPTVMYIQFDGLNVGSLYDSTVLIGAGGENGTIARGYTGAGQVVAVIDTGIDKNHPFLVGKVVDEACYGSSFVLKQYIGVGVPPAVFVTEIDILIKPNCPLDASAVTGPNTGLNCPDTGCDHGTAVAGAITGRTEDAIIETEESPGYTIKAMTGVAPETKLISIKVASKINASIKVTVASVGTSFPLCPLYGLLGYACSVAYDSDIIAGMERVYALRNTHNIAAVNVSLSSVLAPSELEIEELVQAVQNGGNLFNLYLTREECDTNNPIYRAVVEKLTSANIAVISSTGNNNLDRISAPACVSGVISVGASEVLENEQEQVWPNTNIVNFIDLMAPGVNIATSWPGNRYGRETGTSMGAAHVTGAWAVLKQIDNDASIESIRTLLRNTGVEVKDGDLAFKRIQLNAAVDQLLGTLPSPILLAPLPDLVIYKTPMVFTWSPVINATRYTLKVVDQQGQTVFRTRVDGTACTTSCTFSLDIAFKNHERYTWKVTAKSGQAKGKSEPGSFSVEYPGKPSLSYPDANVTLEGETDLTTLAWSQVENAETYRIAVFDVTDGKTRIFKQVPSEQNLSCNGSACLYTVPTELLDLIEDGRIYEWRVQASSQDGKSSSDKRRFTTNFAP
jgi:subtilisin family serine protease